MGFLAAEDEQAVKKQFEKLAAPVTLTVFASELGPENNAQAVSLIKEWPRSRTSSPSRC